MSGTPRRKLQMAVRVAFDSIMSVDQSHQNFGADLWVTLVPNLPADELEAKEVKAFLRGFVKRHEEQILTETSQRPSATMLECWVASANQVDFDDPEKSHPKITFDEKGGTLTWRMLGKFAEAWELKDFPFDCQDFTVSMVIRYPSDKFEMQFMESQAHNLRPFIRNNAFAAVENSWQPPKRKHNQLFVWQELVHRPVARPIQRQRLNVTVQLERIPWYYVSNIVGPMILIVLMSGCSFVIPSKDVADRLSASLTLVLTAVAYKYVVSQMVPPIGYSTRLDRYVTWCFAFLFLVVVENCLAYYLSPYWLWFDLMAGLLLLLAFMVCTTYFGCQARYAMKKPSSLCRKIHRKKEKRDDEGVNMGKNAWKDVVVLKHGGPEASRKFNCDACEAFDALDSCSDSDDYIDESSCSSSD